MDKSPDEEMHGVRSWTKKLCVACEVFWFPSQKLPEKGQALSFWVFKELHYIVTIDWWVPPQVRRVGLKVLSNHGVGFPGSQPHPLMEAKSHLPWSFICNWMLRDQMLPFLPLSIRKFQGFWKLWVRNCEWRPNVCHYVCIWPLCMYVIYVAGRGGSKRTLSVSLNSQ